MATLRSRLKIPVWVVAVVVLLAAGTVAAVTVGTLNFNPIEPAEGTVSNSADLSISSSDITYSGLTATQVNVTVSNSGGSSHGIAANLTVKDSGGTVLDSGSTTDSVPSGGSVELSFNINVQVSNLAEVEILVEQTS